MPMFKTWYTCRGQHWAPIPHGGIHWQLGYTCHVVVQKGCLALPYSMAVKNDLILTTVEQPCPNAFGCFQVEPVVLGGLMTGAKSCMNAM